MDAVRSASAGSVGGVNGFWLILDTVTGHFAYIKAAGASPSQPDLTAAILRELGATSASQVQAYYLGGDPNNLVSEADKALSALNVSTDQIPGDKGFFATLLSKGFQAGNFDILVPAGVNPNQYQQGTQQAGAAATGTVNTAKGLVGALTGNLSGDLSSVLAFAIRALEALAGAALILLGLQALTGQSGNPVHAVKRAASKVTP